MRRPARALRAVASGVAVAALALAGVALTATSASAAVFTVDTDDDGNVGMTLRAAVELANSTPGYDVVNFNASLANQTILLDPAKGSIIVTDRMAINGLGVGSLTVGRASGSFDLFELDMAATDYDFQMANFTLLANGAVDGGRGVDADDVAIQPRNIEIYNMAFTGLNAGQGGAVRILGTSGSVTVEDSTFNGNGAEVGGAMFVSLATDGVRVDNVLFGNNRAVDDGGALCIASTEEVEIEDIVVEDGAAGARGGAGCFVDLGFLQIIGAEFTNNTAVEDGGALFVGGVDSVDFRENVFDSNSSGTDDAYESTGGAIYFEEVSDVFIVGTDFIDNDSETGGAVFSSVNERFSMFESLFSGNRAIGDTSGGFGGALYLQGALIETVIGQTSFLNNTATQVSDGGMGGAVYVERIDADTFFFINSSTFAGNVIDGGNGISFIVGEVGGVLSIYNSTFDEHANASPEDTMVHVSNLFGAFGPSHSTFSGPHPIVVINNDGFTEVSHNIFEGAASSLFVDNGDPIFVQWSLFETALADNSIVSVEGNQFSTDPKLGPLQDNGGPTLTRLLLPGSAAVDKGDPTFTDDGFDQRGEGFPRVLHEIVDIGAIEVPFVLPPTGQSISLIVPIAGGVLLLAGIAAVVIGRLRRKASHSA